MSKKEPIIPGEWQKEPGAYGRWYRRFGNMIEYRAVLETVADERDRQRALEDARQAQEQAQEERTCPFADGKACKRERCALFGADGCALAAFEAVRDTEGLRCPFSPYRCNARCAVYRVGCVITGFKGGLDGRSNETGV